MQNGDPKIKDDKKQEVSGRPNGDKDRSKDEVAHLKQDISELENSIKRVYADYQNLEKRVTQEKREMIINANKHLLLRLLPVLDTLMVALKHTKDKGLELSIKQFVDTLKAEGVRRIEVQGKNFDPKLMECIEVCKGEEGKVVSEILAGYLLNDLVLRPAMVKVGKKNIVKKEEELAKKEIQKGDYM